MLTTDTFAVAVAITALLIYGWLFYERYRTQDGVGRVYFLIFDGVMLAYFLTRLASIFFIPPGEIQREMNRGASVLLLIPGICIAILHYRGRR